MQAGRGGGKKDNKHLECVCVYVCVLTSADALLFQKVMNYCLFVCLHGFSRQEGPVIKS